MDFHAFSTRSATTNNNSSRGLLNLNKGDILDLTKTEPSLKHVILAAGWDISATGQDNFDLDISAFMCEANGRVRNANTQVVYFNQLAQQGIYLEGDNKTGSNDEGDDERININLDEIPPEIQSIVFNVNIFDCIAKRQSFGMVNHSYIRLLDADNNERELCRFELKEQAASATAVTFAKLFRTGNGGWSFEAIGDSFVANDLEQILLKYYQG